MDFRQLQTVDPVAARFGTLSGRRPASARQRIYAVRDEAVLVIASHHEAQALDRLSAWFRPLSAAYVAAPRPALTNELVEEHFHHDLQDDHYRLEWLLNPTEERRRRLYRAAAAFQAVNERFLRALDVPEDAR